MLTTWPFTKLLTSSNRFRGDIMKVEIPLGELGGAAMGSIRVDDILAASFSACFTICSSDSSTDWIVILNIYFFY